MAKREIEEINASSMADIAFLLLVFFLVTSTFLKERVQDERLPQKIEQEGIKIRPYNVLEIKANKNDLILVEEDIYITEGDEAREIADLMHEFYRHPASESEVKWPATSKVSTSLCEYEIQRLEGMANQYPDISQYADSVKLFKKKLKTCEVLGGSYTEISSKAVVAITLDNTTSYATYIKVLDGILLGLSEMREELCQNKFERSFADLDDDIEEEKEILDAIKMVFPKRIFKTKGTAAAE